MSYVIAAPEMMTAATTDLAGIGSALSEAHKIAAAPTTAVLPAAADEVSAGIAHLFSRYAQDFHALAGQAAAFQEQFVQHLTAGVGAYAATEAANASLLQPLNAAAGTFSITELGQILNLFTGQILNLLTQTLPAFLHQFLNMIATAPLQTLFTYFWPILFSPILGPAGLLVYAYFLLLLDYLQVAG